MFRCVAIRVVLVLAEALVAAPAVCAGHFTSRSQSAVKFGVHEITLIGNGSVTNPFDTVVRVRFTPPSGAAKARMVWAFYDGGDTWRARVYVSEPGAWNWSSACPTDKRLHGQSGAFESSGSKLRGRLLPHPKNPRQWMTEDGRWFLNLEDTAYFLLSSRDHNGRPIPEEDFQAYVHDAVNHGITSFMTSLLTNPASVSEAEIWSKMYFADAGFSRLRLDNFRFADHRLRWLLDHYPDVGLELILLPRGAGYGRDEHFWRKLNAEQKERILRYLVARYAAYPQFFWIIANDTHYGKKFPNNNAYVREVGAFFKKHDPWQHPLSTGHARRVDFFFGEEDWATFLHLENAYDLGASEYAQYHRFAKPVLLGEDRYEQDHPNRLDPTDMRYFQRRLYWAWLLSGGSANYGGRWWVLHPYTQTGKRQTPNPRPAYNFTHKAPLRGLDSVKQIHDYFANRKIELSAFVPDHGLAHDLDGAAETRAPKLMRRGREEYLIYHPNAADDAKEAKADAKKEACMKLDLCAVRASFTVEWYRAEDGAVHDGGTLKGGQEVRLVSPWAGHDVVVRLSKLQKRR